MKEVIGFYNDKKVFGWMSNWYPAAFTVDGVAYTSSEQYMMHRKALYFGDTASAERILAENDCKTVKALGRKVAPFDPVEWAGVRQIIVYRGLLEKFRQNPELREKLLATGDAILAECSPLDRVWGIGMGTENEDRLDTAKWRGTNILGFTLMQVREQLRREAE